MKAAHWTMIGLCFDIIGALFLSVEAIKLENVRKLREKFLQPIHRVTLSPPIQIVERQETKTRWKERVFVAVYFILHLLAGVALLFVVNFIFRGLISQLTIRSWYGIISLSLWFSIPLFIVTLWFGIFGLWMLGEIVHMSITRVSLSVVRMAEFIEHRTATGVVGLIGLGLLLVGFVLQFYGTYASLPVPSP